MAQLRKFMLPAGPPADTLERLRRRPARGPSWASSSSSTARYSARSGRTTSAGTERRARQRGRRRPRLLRVLPRPGERRRGSPFEPTATSLGVGYTGRNAPTVINAAYSPLWQFWDGRADSLWSQALSPPEGTAECASSRLRVVHFLYDHYRKDFEDLFGDGSLPSTIRACPWTECRAIRTRRTSARAERPNAGAVQRRVRLHLDDGRDDGEPRLRELRQGDRRLRTKAGQQQLRAVAVRRLHGGRQERDVAGGDSRRAPVRRPGRLHRVPPGTDVHRLRRSTTSASPRPGEYAKPIDNGRKDGVGPLAVSMFNRKSADFSDDTSKTEYLDALTTEPPDELPRRVQDADVAQRQQDGAVHARRRLPDAVGRREPLQLRRRDRHLRRRERSRRSPR